MFSRKKLMMGAVAFILGFILVLEFQSGNSPESRDTRDIWQLREDLSEQKKLTKHLNEERREVSDLLAKYENNEGRLKVRAMRDALHELKKEAGLTKVSGQGIVIHVEPLVSGSLIGESYHPVTAQLLRRLINELNSFGAREIAIGGERVIATTPIRNVNGQVYVNDERIPDVPFEIKVLAPDAQKLHDELVVSESRREFAKAKLKLTSEIANHLTLPAYDRPILIQHMTVAEEVS